MSGSPLSRLPSILGQIDHHRRPSPLRRCGGARRRRARVAPHQAGRQVRLPSSSTCTPVRDRSGPAWLLDMAPGRSQEGPQDLARPARPGLAWAGRGGGDGQLHRFQERRWRGVPQGPGSLGLLRASCHWLPASSTSAAAASNERYTRHQGREGDQLYRARRNPMHRGRPAHQRRGQASRDFVRR